MFPQHPRAGITHDGPDLFAPVTLIAMNWAFGAGRFFGTEPAAIQPEVSVIQKALALGTEAAVVSL